MAQAAPVAAPITVGLGRQLEQFAREQAQLQQALTGVLPPDKLAWLFNTQTNVILKAHKYDRGAPYRQLVQSLVPLYKAEKRRRKVSGKEAYNLYYDIVATTLQKMAAASAILEVVQSVQQGGQR